MDDATERGRDLNAIPDHRARSRRNRFSGGPLDRAGEHRHDPEWLAAREADPGTRFVLVWRSRLLVAGHAASMPARAHVTSLLEAASVIVFLGEWRGTAYFAADVSPLEDEAVAAVAPDAEFRDLREAAMVLPAPEAAVLAQARAMVYWHRRHRFCGRCGTETRSEEGGYVRVCPNPHCGRRDFPRTDPAIIVLTTAGDRCLLGRQPHWPAGRFSTVAGFVEPGESAEDAVAREVFEETGVRIDAVHYHSSQPWPFPASLMLGFTAEARTQAVSLLDGELEQARWFSRADIRDGLRDGSFALPPPLSVAFHLIEDWFDQASGEPLRQLLDIGNDE